MAEKGFGVKEINLIGASGTPTIESPNNINMNAVNVAISTNVSIGGTLSVTGNISVGGTLTYEDVTNIDSIGIVTARSGVVTPNVDVDDFVTVGSNIQLGNAGVVTATTFSGSGASLTSIPAGQLTGTVADARISTLTASKLSGALPAISGANLTNLDASDLASGTIPDARFPATLPAVSGANLTNLPSPTPANSDIQVAYTVTANGSSAYRFEGNGVVSSADNPDIYLIRGQKYRFINNSGGSHPFQIREASGGTAYSTGVTNNGASSGNIDFAPTYDSPAQLVYQCTNHGSMVGNIYLRDAAGNNTNVGVTTFTGDLTIPDKIIHSGDTNTAIRFPAADTITAETGGSERLRILSSGRLLYGDHLNNRGAELQYEGSQHACLGLHRNANSHGAPALQFSASRGTSAGSNTIVQNGDYLGMISFKGTDGSDLADGAYITARVDGTPGNNDMPARLDFWTSPDGSQSPVERLRIDSTGTIKLYGDGGNNVKIYGHDGSDLSWILGQNNSDDVELNNFRSGNLLLKTNGSEKLRIASNGHVGINQSSPERQLHIVGNDGATGATLGNSDTCLVLDNQGTNGAIMEFLSDNNGAGRIQFTDTDGSNRGQIQYIHSSDTLALTSSGGNPGYELRSASQSFFNVVNSDVAIDKNNTGTIVNFIKSGNSVGTISISSSSTSFNTSSDYRLKENVVAITNAITRLKTLKPYRFNFKSDSKTTVDGFLAHEVTAVPEAVTGSKDQVATADDVTDQIKEGDPIYQSIDQSKLVPLLTAALQEQQEQIENLQAEVDALKAK